MASTSVGGIYVLDSDGVNEIIKLVESNGDETESVAYEENSASVNDVLSKWNKRLVKRQA